MNSTSPLPTGPSPRTRRLLAAAASIGAAVVLTAAMAQASDYASGVPSAQPGHTPKAGHGNTATPGHGNTGMTGAGNTGMTGAGNSGMTVGGNSGMTGAGKSGTTGMAEPAVAGPATTFSGTQRMALSFQTVDDAADPTFNQLLGINNRGRIVGYFGSGADAMHPNKGFLVRSPYAQNNFFDENVPGSAQTQVVGINNSGTTVGFSVDAAGANTGFIERSGSFTPVMHPATPAGAPFNQLLGVNDYGVAVGFYNDAAGASHGYTFDPRTGRFGDVVLPVRADSVTATGLADDGTVSGFYTVDKVTRAFLLRHGHFQRLSFGAGTNTQALGINDRHEVVGSYLDAAGTMHGFWWSPTRGMTRVDDPNAAAGTLVNGLNGRGQLVGFYVDAAGNTHGFLATRRS